MDASNLIDALGKKLNTASSSELAEVLGVTQQTLINWKKGERLKPTQVAAMLAKSQNTAIKMAQRQTILPIVEFYPINRAESKQGAQWNIFDSGKGAVVYAQGLKEKLDKCFGVYIFYNSSGHALYVGKARKQTLWKEMNLAFNRDRNQKQKVQKIALVKHPERNQEFLTGYEKLRKIEDVPLELFDLAFYFSAYEIDQGMIDDIETLMIRGFANDLLNISMGTFQHTRSAKT